MPLFTAKERSNLLERITEIAQSDGRVSGGALVGSFANNATDKFSDIDISFGVKTECDPLVVLDEWTELLKSEFKVIDYFDVLQATAIYRVILFSNGLEIDLSVVPEKDYGSTSPNFKLLFGEAIKRTTFPGQDLRTLIGWSWHHVLHANSAIERRRFWQAEYWIGNLRHHIISMKCIRLGLPSAHGRGADKIDHAEMKSLESSLIQGLDAKELKRALKILSEELIIEVRHEDADLSSKFHNVFQKALENQESEIKN